MTFDEWETLFAKHGPQVGDPMPQAALVDIDGEPVQLATLWADRPAVLVSASLTCPVARRRLPELAPLLEPFGDQINRGVLYTKEAHPAKDKAPHADGEWLTTANKQAGIIHRQPTSMTQRLALAELFRDGWGGEFRHFVDSMDDGVYDLFGTAPCTGLLIGPDGIVRIRQGWLIADQMAIAVRALLDTAGIPVTSGDEA